LCFHGHTHIQKIYRRDRSGDTESVAPLQNLSEAKHALVCPGSVGQPRAGEPGVELAIIDLSSGSIEFQRLPYNCEQTINDMRKFHFPPGLADRLQQGK